MRFCQLIKATLPRNLLAVATMAAVQATAQAGGTNLFFDGEAGPDTSYLNALNWSQDEVPVAPDDAIIGINQPPGISPAIVTLEATPPPIGTIQVGVNGGIGELTQTGGELLVFESFFLGAGPDGASGAYQLLGDGSVKLQKGTQQRFNVGVGDTAMGQLLIDTTGELNSQRTIVGDGFKGFGSITLENGMHVASQLILGAHNDASGEYQARGGGLIVDSGFLTIGGQGRGLLSATENATVQSPAGAIVGRSDMTSDGEPTQGRGLLELIGSQVTIDLGQLAFGHDCGGIACNPTNAEGTLRFISEQGVSPIRVDRDLLLNNATLEVDLETDPVAGDVLLIAHGGDRSGIFFDENGNPLLEDTPVPGSNGRVITYDFPLANLGSGQGNPPIGIGLVFRTTLFESDFDKDGDVDGEDFLVWQANFGTAATTRNDGDADEDGDVDGQDFLLWQAQFGMMSGSGSVASVVPEGNALATLLAVWIAAYAIRPRIAG